MLPRFGSSCLHGMTHSELADTAGKFKIPEIAFLSLSNFTFHSILKTSSLIKEKLFLIFRFPLSKSTENSTGCCRYFTS